MGIEQSRHHRPPPPDTHPTRSVSTISRCAAEQYPPGVWCLGDRIMSHGPAVPVIGRVRRHRQRLVNTPPRPDQTQSTWRVSTFVDGVDSTPRPLHAYLAMPDAASPAPGRMGLRPCPAGPYHREVAAFPHSPSGHGFVNYCCAMLWKLCYVVQCACYACAACRYLVTPDAILHASGYMPPGQLEPSTP